MTLWLVFVNPVTYDNSGHGNDNGKVNHVAANKFPQQMAFHGVVYCLHGC